MQIKFNFVFELWFASSDVRSFTQQKTVRHGKWCIECLRCLRCGGDVAYSEVVFREHFLRYFYKRNKDILGFWLNYVWRSYRRAYKRNTWITDFNVSVCDLWDTASFEFLSEWWTRWRPGLLIKMFGCLQLSHSLYSFHITVRNVAQWLEIWCVRYVSISWSQLWWRAVSTVQVDYHGTQNSMTSRRLYDDVTAMAAAPARWSANWQQQSSSVSSTCCGRPCTVVPPLGQGVGVGPGHVTGGYDLPVTPVLSDEGANSRDSWTSSTSSNVVGPRAPASAQHQYSYRQQQQHYHQLYDWAGHHQRHTWGQVETNQSRCHQVYPQHAQQQQQQVLPRPHNDRHHRPTLFAHPYYHRNTGIQVRQRYSLPRASFRGGMTHEVVEPGRQNVYVAPPAYNVLPTTQFVIRDQPSGQRQHSGTPVWTATEDQCVVSATTSAQPVSASYQRQLGASSGSTTTTAWYSMDSTATPAGKDTPQQPAVSDLVSSNRSSSNDVSLSSGNVSLLWSPDACYDSLIDWFTP